MSAITYPSAADRGRAPKAPSASGLRRRLAKRRHHRWDDRASIERNASPSEVVLRAVPELPNIYR